MSGLSDLSTVSDNLVQLAATWAGRIVGVLITLFIAWLVAGWARRALLRQTQKRSLDPTLGRFSANLARYAILAGAVIGCLGVFGIETASFAALIAAMGLAIGLAFQGTLSNFSAGAMLLAFRPFRVGDFVRAAGEMGTIEEIELFTTTLSTPDNRRLIIPNGKIFGDVIENFSHNSTRRVDVPVGVSYGAAIDDTRRVLLEVAASTEGVLKEPAPVAFLKEFGDSSVNWQLRAWVKTADFWDVHQALVRGCKLALDREKIEIPFPQLDVHVQKLPR